MHRVRSARYAAMSTPPRSVPDWLAWQERLNPQLVDLGLDRLRPVAARMGLTGPGAPLITVAGTNGKGSTVAFLEALALACGVVPACYVSPWLLRYNESVRIGGRAVCDGVLIAAFERVEAAREDVPLTAFEFRTLAAVDVIRCSGAGLALLEVGLGGRLDAVNLFDATVAVITSIGLDHGEWLGDTLQCVAREKAGILRRGRAAVCADPACTPLLAPLVRDAGAVPWLGGHELAIATHGARWSLRWGSRHLGDLPSPTLDGEHQRLNAAAAIVAFELSGVAAAALDSERVGHALRIAQIRGRLERLPGPQERRVDVAHNPQAAAVLARWIEPRFAASRVRAVCAMYADKDHRETLRVLAPRVGEWYLADLPPPRGAPAARLRSALAEVAPAATAHTFASVEQAWRAAAGDAAGGTGAALLLAFGSFETARRVLRLESTAGSLET
jgi:dihydrofolate synthase/folylpolyglutamate synthase